MADDATLAGLSSRYIAASLVARHVLDEIAALEAQATASQDENGAAVLRNLTTLLRGAEVSIDLTARQYTVTSCGVQLTYPLDGPSPMTLPTAAVRSLPLA